MSVTEQPILSKSIFDIAFESLVGVAELGSSLATSGVKGATSALGSATAGLGAAFSQGISLGGGASADQGPRIEAPAIGLAKQHEAFHADFNSIEVPVTPVMGGGRSAGVGI